MQKHPKLSLIERFEDLTDPRVDRTKDHDLIDVLIIAVCSDQRDGSGFVAASQAHNDARHACRPGV